MVAKVLARSITRTLYIKLSSKHAALAVYPSYKWLENVGCATSFNLSMAEYKDHDAIDPRYLSAFLIFPALSLAGSAWSPTPHKSTPETCLRGKCDRRVKEGKEVNKVNFLVLDLSCKSMQHGLIQPGPSLEGNR